MSRVFQTVSGDRWHITPMANDDGTVTLRIEVRSKDGKTAIATNHNCTYHRAIAIAMDIKQAINSAAMIAMSRSSKE